MKISLIKRKGFLLIALIGSLLIGCSKDKQQERSLYSKGGEWFIHLWSDKIEIEGSSNTYTYDYYNAGWFIFEKDGTGILKAVMDGENYLQSFYYKKSGSTLSIIWGAGNLFAVNGFDQFAIEWNWDTTETFKTFKLIGNSEGQAYDENDNTFSIFRTSTIYCSKKEH